ncbi:MAG: hypothetical protein FJ206_05660 [Gemmatimonadetes bacterium]|nr:hypothetical protein [Gemmatimonadota bacterium]
MTRATLAFAVAVLTSAATLSVVGQASAQADAPAAAAANPKLEGTWEGTYTTDGPSGGMTIVLKAGTPWSISNTLSGEAPPPGDPRELAVAGDTVTWKQVFGEYDVSFKATLGADGKLAGALEAFQGGSFVAGGSFSLARK